MQPIRKATMEIVPGLAPMAIAIAEVAFNGWTGIGKLKKSPQVPDGPRAPPRADPHAVLHGLLAIPAGNEPSPYPPTCDMRKGLGSVLRSDNPCFSGLRDTTPRRAAIKAAVSYSPPRNGGRGRAGESHRDPFRTP